MVGPRKDPDKNDRALELSEKGLNSGVIAARLGVEARSVHTMLKRAKAKREKKAERDANRTD